MWLADDLENVVTVGAVAIHREVTIKTRRPSYPKTLHQREASSVDDRELLIDKSIPDLPCQIEILCRHSLDDRRAISDAVPKRSA